MRRKFILNRLLKGLCVSALALSFAACSGREDSRGVQIDPEILAEITPGEHSREEVAEILGSPSSTALFDRETWYYISEHTETLAFFAPEVSERKIIVLTFDAEGVVADLKVLGKEDGRSFSTVDRETPSVGKELTFLDQIFGNLGRYKTHSAGRK
jgi:outer membrane protein assembly factor BamE (lipoprotein component of BamABCDE complex)